MELVNIILQGVLLGGLYALFAAGLSLIFGVMRLVNIAHGDLIVAFAYMAYFVMAALHIGPFTSLLLNVPVAALLRHGLHHRLRNWTIREVMATFLATIGSFAAHQYLPVSL